ncbi:MAG: hypothetical protein JWR69_4212 [Pedosphaera sp.]|nr:hypothetical protein [Pedosphaera sp.]
MRAASGVFTHERKATARVKKPMMQNSKNSDRLPNAAERKKISDHAKQTLAQAWALRDYLDEWEIRMDVSALGKAARQGVRERMPGPANQP